MSCAIIPNEMVASEIVKNNLLIILEYHTVPGTV
jgi:hypothetical protein